jgi:hypothetical protein
MSRESTLPARRQYGKKAACSRLGLDVGKQMRKNLIRRVWKGEVKYARRLTRSRTVIVLDYNGEEIAFLYSGTSKEIVSFLTPNAPETAEWRRTQAARVLAR